MQKNCQKVSDDTWKSVSWNALYYGDDYESWKERKKYQRWPVWPGQEPSDG